MSLCTCAVVVWGVYTVFAYVCGVRSVYRVCGLTCVWCVYMVCVYSAFARVCRLCAVHTVCAQTVVCARRVCVQCAQCVCVECTVCVVSCVLHGFLL